MTSKGEKGKGLQASNETARAPGRPSLYTGELADQICAQLADGRSLRSVCKAEDMPAASTVFGWLRSNPEFLQQYARAKEASADALIDEILDIADDSRRDFEQTKDGPVFNHEHVQRARLRIDARKWVAAKLLPRKYGDRVDLSHAGPNGEPLVPAAAAPVIVLGSEAARAIAQQLLETV